MNISDKSSLLLHVCCAPCSGPVIEKLTHSGLRPTVFFYNPNIHPREEYHYRKASVITFAKKLGLPMIDMDYDPENWLNRTKGLEQEPERGRRCSICFDIRLERTARYAFENGFKYFATTNGISRRKNLDQVNQNGTAAAARYPGISFMAVDWRESGGSGKVYRIAKIEKFYKQEYCGCIFSLQKRNEQLQAIGHPPVQHGANYYTDIIQ